MSGAPACNCTVKDDTEWRILDFKCNHSAFNGYRHTPSDYSKVWCRVCGRVWRTKAKYVERLHFE